MHTIILTEICRTGTNVHNYMCIFIYLYSLAHQPPWPIHYKYLLNSLDIFKLCIRSGFQCRIFCPVKFISDYSKVTCSFILHHWALKFACVVCWCIACSLCAVFAEPSRLDATEHTCQLRLLAWCWILISSYAATLARHTLFVILQNV